MEPGCGFRGDYLVVALEKFKTPYQTSFRAHRVKEIVTFDAASFPLQAAMVESMIEASALTKAGEDIWAECKEQEEGSELSKVDAQYMELFGEIPSDDLTLEQKYQKITLELSATLTETRTGTSSRTRALPWSMAQCLRQNLLTQSHRDHRAMRELRTSSVLLMMIATDLPCLESRRLRGPCASATRVP